MRFVVLSFALFLALSGELSAQSKSFQSLISQFIGADSSASPAPPASEQLEWIKEQLKASQEQLQKLQNDESAAELIASAEQIVRNQTFSQTTLESVLRLESELEDLKDKPTPAPPKTPAALKAAKDTVADLKSRLAASATEQSLMSQMLAEATNAEQSSETALLQLKDAPVADQQAAQLRRDVDKSALFNLKWRQYLETLHSQLNEAQLQQLERSIEISGLDVQINPSRAQDALAALAQERTAVSDQLAKVQKTSEGLSQQLNSLIEQTKQGDISEVAKSQITILKNSVAAANQLAVGLDATLQLIGIEEKHWSTVNSLASTKDVSLFQKTREAIQHDLAWISKNKPPLLQRFQDTSRALEQLTARADTAWRDKSLRPLLEKQQAIVNDRVEMLRALLQRIEQINSYEEQLATEVEAKLLEQSVREKVSVALKDGWNRLIWLWNLVLYANPANSTVITVGKLIIGIIALCIAFTLASSIARRAALTASRRFKTDPTKSVLIEKWVSYTLTVILVLTVLNWLSIPLTVFAFLGGALAIGIGFGGQNLMNNFISGIILLFERRVNVGDIVEVDGHTGKIVHLGSRSSRVRKFDGVDVLVPNSYFLEKNVINWTLSDPNHRYDFIVGIAYGSSVETCLVLFQELLESHPDVLKDPAPFVFFENFGENTLDFRFYYWLPVNTAINTGRVGSDLRVKVNAVCREAKIEIAYPQRDVHLSTAKPLEVRLRKEGTGDL